MLTKLPIKTLDYCPTPKEIMPKITELRDAALKAEHWDFAVILSHTHAWLHWLDANWTELNKGE